MNKFNLELENLSEKMASNGYEFGSGFDKVLSYYRHRLLELIVSNHNNNGSVLEVGGAMGLGTAFLKKHFQDLEVIEPVSKYVNILRNKFIKDSKSLPIYRRTLEEHRDYSEKKYDWIIAFNVLEHVDNAKIFLRCAYELMKNDGRLVLTIPNANSLHRQLGLKMGIISNLNSLAHSDKMIGHKRYYDNDSIKSELVEAGFKLMFTMGNFLKPFPNKVMESIDAKCYEGLHKLGGAYKSMSAELFTLAIKKR